MRSDHKRHLMNSEADIEKMTGIRNSATPGHNEKLMCHCLNVFGQAVLFGPAHRRHCFSEDSSEASPQTKVAIIAPRDEHCSRTYQNPIRMFSKKEFKPSICPDAEATLESFPTHAHHAER